MSSSSAPAWVTDLFCPILGVIITNIMWLSPLKAVRYASKWRDLGELNPIPFPLTFYNCIGWVIYGCLTKNYIIFWGNVFGILTSVYYSLTCLLLCTLDEAKEDKYLKLIQCSLLFSLLFWSIVGFVVGIVIEDKAMGNFIVGILSCIGGFFYYVSPLSTMLAVVKTRDSSSIDPRMVATNFCCACLWFFYSLFSINDPLVVGTYLR